MNGLSSISEKIQWFGNDGGPMLILPREAFCFWEGTNNPSGGRIINSDFLPLYGSIYTDYDRACNAKYPAEFLQVGSSWGLAISETGASAAWLNVLDSNTRVAVCMMWGDDDSPRRLREIYSQVPECEWQINCDFAPIKLGELLLMHAACASEINTHITRSDGLAVIGDALVETIPAALVRIDSCVVELPDEEALISFHRFQKATNSSGL